MGNRGSVAAALALLAALGCIGCIGWAQRRVELVMPWYATFPGSGYSASPGGEVIAGGGAREIVRGAIGLPPGGAPHGNGWNGDDALNGGNKEWAEEDAALHAYNMQLWRNKIVQAQVKRQKKQYDLLNAGPSGRSPGGTGGAASGGAVIGGDAVTGGGAPIVGGAAGGAGGVASSSGIEDELKKFSRGLLDKFSRDLRHVVRGMRRGGRGRLPARQEHKKDSMAKIAKDLKKIMNKIKAQGNKSSKVPKKEHEVPSAPVRKPWNPLQGPGHAEAKNTANKYDAPRTIVEDPKWDFVREYAPAIWLADEDQYGPSSIDFWARHTSLEQINTVGGVAAWPLERDCNNMNVTEMPILRGQGISEDGLGPPAYAIVLPEVGEDPVTAMTHPDRSKIRVVYYTFFPLHAGQTMPRAESHGWGAQWWRRAPPSASAGATELEETDKQVETEKNAVGVENFRKAAKEEHNHAAEFADWLKRKLRRQHDNHLGDWERVMIHFDSGRPVNMNFIRKGGDITDEALSWEAVEKERGHPVAYAADGTHSYYSRPGVHRTMMGPEHSKFFHDSDASVFSSDLCSRGKRWDTWKNLVVLPPDHWKDLKVPRHTSAWPEGLRYLLQVENWGGEIGDVCSRVPSGEGGGRGVLGHWDVRAVTGTNAFRDLSCERDCPWALGNFHREDLDDEHNRYHGHRRGRRGHRH